VDTVVDFAKSWTHGMASLIGLFAPGTAIGYIRRRQALASYAAASTSGPNQAWRPGNKSADEIIKTDHKLMRGRARSLIRDSAHVSGAIRKICNNVVFRGIKPQANLTLPDGSLSKKQNDAVEDARKRWADKVRFHEMENLVLRHLWSDGELFVHYYFDPALMDEGLIPMGIELLECDHLDTTKNSYGPGGRIKQGIQYDAGGHVEGYWLFPEHPGDSGWLGLDKSVFYPVSVVDHIFVRERISQNRGVSWLAAIVMEMRDFYEYQSGERIAKRLAAAMGLFVTTPYPENLGNFNPFTGIDPLTVDNIPNYMESGRILTLPPGMTIESPNTDRPGQTYEPYTKTSLRGASTGVGMSYETYSNDYTDASYSSARSASLEERRGYMVQQMIISSRFHAPGWVRLWQMNYLSKTLPSVPETIPVSWQVPGWPWVDPYKDSKAAEQDLKNGITSRHKLCMERGVDYDEIMADRTREKKDGFDATDLEGKTI